MTLDDIQSLYQYNEWANGRQLEIIASLDDEQLTTQIASSFGSILQTFAHIVGSEWVWLRRFQGESPQEMPDWVSSPVLSQLGSKLSSVEGARAAYLSALTDLDLQSNLNYRTMSGALHTTRLLDLLLHVVNHSTYHRGQLTTMLRQVGSTPVAVDYVLFKRIQSEAPETTI